MSDDLYNEIYNLRQEIQTIKDMLSQIKSELVNLRVEIRQSKGTEQDFSLDKPEPKVKGDWKTRGWG